MTIQTFIVIKISFALRNYFKTFSLRNVKKTVLLIWIFWSSMFTKQYYVVNGMPYYLKSSIYQIEVALILS